MQVILVKQERADEPAGFEPVLADPTHLDLAWLAEDQALLALPLVPLHEPGACEEAPAQVAADIQEEDEVGTRQKPFQNLRDMMRKH
jgi:uncharacterized protein